MIILTG